MQHPQQEMANVPNNNRKHRFCATFPTVSKCKQGRHCPFAHSRDEVLGPVCSEAEERLEGVSPDFFMWTHKTIWCPIGSFHDWQECIYAHNYQDVRRDPRVGYCTMVCPDWERSNRSPNYADRCPRGFACGYCHGAKEQLYHPAYFHTVMCNDHFHGKGCPRGKTCAFFHKKKDKRAPPNWPNHGDTIPEAIIATFLQPDINFPPFPPAAESSSKGKHHQQHDQQRGASGGISDDESENHGDAATAAWSNQASWMMQQNHAQQGEWAGVENWPGMENTAGWYPPAMNAMGGYPMPPMHAAKAPIAMVGAKGRGNNDGKAPKVGREEESTEQSQDGQNYSDPMSMIRAAGANQQHQQQHQQQAWGGDMGALSNAMTVEALEGWQDPYAPWGQVPFDNSMNVGGMAADKKAAANGNAGGKRDRRHRRHNKK